MLMYTCYFFSILWSGTPILTWPRHRHKMCSRVAASIVNATGFGKQMTVQSGQEYEDRAVQLAQSVSYVMETNDVTPASPQQPPQQQYPPAEPIRRGRGELVELRRNLFLSREKSALFDTARWTKNLETAYWEMWRRWAEGSEFEDSDEWANATGPEKDSGCIWLQEESGRAGVAS
jgi:protein O-GlcNAc transferase